MEHVPVLLHESIEGLELAEGDTVVDATLGLGGHSEVLLREVGATGTLVGIECDHTALVFAQKRLDALPGVKHLVHNNFKYLNTILSDLEITQVNGFLFDLGWNSSQLHAGRGLSFQKDEPLIMTLSSDITEDTVTARDVVNTWSQENLKETLETLGEERFSKRIAEAIVEKRKEGSIETTHQLTDIILSATPGWYHNKKIHPATRTFQALRIVVNDELSSVTTALPHAFDALSPGGRIAVITFHSLEDGLVKRTFKKLSTERNARIITKKPIAPTREEITENPRSRSAKLRIIEKHD